MAREEVRRFQRAADEVASFLKPKLDSGTRAKIITHTDADGISAAAILARCFYNYNVPFHLTFSRPIKPNEVPELAKEDYDLFVFTDQGSGQVSAIHKHLLGAGRDVLILDHHPGDFPEHPKLAYLNPHACDLNGAKDISASGVVYSVIERLDKSFRPLVGLAMVGALGDRQEFFSGFTGVNEVLVKRAIDLDMVGTGEGLKLIGRTLSPVAECLRLSIRPYLPDLTGDLEACRELAGSLGISLKDTTAQLGREREASLRDALFARSDATTTSEDFRHTLWGTLYAPKAGEWAGPADLHEFVAMLDACEKLGTPELGFAAAMGDEAAATNALALLRRYQEEMVAVLRWFEDQREKFKATPQMRYIYAGKEVDSKMIGEAISLAMESGLVETDRPVIGMVDSKGDLKVSARATPSYAMQGADLGEVLGKVARALDGTGGGHDVAAAARVPLERRDEFIAKLDKTLAQVAGA